MLRKRILMSGFICLVSGMLFVGCGNQNKQTEAGNTAQGRIETETELQEAETGDEGLQSDASVLAANEDSGVLAEEIEADMGMTESAVAAGKHNSEPGRYDYLNGKELPNSRAYVEQCIDYANQYFEPGKEGGSDFDNNIVAWSMQDDGHGIGIFVGEDGIEVYGMSNGSGMNPIILRTEDGGETWEVNPKPVSMPVGECQLTTFGEYVIFMIDYNAHPGQGCAWTSIGYGEMLQCTSYAELMRGVIGENCDLKLEMSASVSGNVKEYDEENGSADISWSVSGREVYAARYLFTSGGSLSMARILDQNQEALYEIKAADSVNAAVEPYYFGSYIFPQSGFRYLTEEDIEAVCYYCEKHGEDTAMVLRRAINEIYARMGYDFTGTQYYKDYLSSKSWYHPVSGKTVAESEMNPYEKANIDLLVSFEKKYK